MCCPFQISVAIKMMSSFHFIFNLSGLTLCECQHLLEQLESMLMIHSQPILIKVVFGASFRITLVVLFSILCNKVRTDSIIQIGVMVIKEGLLIIAASRWSSSTTFHIKSDFTNTVAWFSNFALAPSSFQNIIREIVQKFGYHIKWTISHIRHTGSKMVDVLARFGTSVFTFIGFIQLYEMISIFQLSLFPHCYSYFHTY